MHVFCNGIPQNANSCSRISSWSLKRVQVHEYQFSAPDTNLRHLESLHVYEHNFWSPVPDREVDRVPDSMLARAEMPE
jgi:hypothetical protein